MSALVVGCVSVYLPASGPTSVRPLTVTSLPVPTSLSAKTPTALVVSSVTVSPVSTPTSTALLTISVALFVPSYTLFWASMPETVSPAGRV